MDEDLDVGRLGDAALVRSARREIDEAIAVLAVRPLDEAAAEQMRRALGPRTCCARSALQRLRADEPGTPAPAPAGGTRLTVVTAAAGEVPPGARGTPGVARVARRARSRRFGGAA